MKNFLNLNQLSMSWNEKQKPQRLRRYAVMLMMLLTLGVGQMWGWTLYLYTGSFSDNGNTWESSSATFKLWTDKDVTATSMGNHWYSFNCGSYNSGTVYVKRCSSDGNTKWNEFSFSSNGSDKYYKVTGWNAGTAFTAQTITISRNNSSYGSVSPSSVKAGSSIESVNFTATPATNYAFVNWTRSNSNATISNANSATTKITTASGSCTVTANFAPQWTLKGGDSDDTGNSSSDAMGNWETFNNFALTSGTTMKCTLALAAKTTYSFKIVDRRTNTWYGNNSAFMGQTSSLTMNSSHGDCHITTAKAGNYIFTFDNSAKTLTVAYPSETHPSANYIYFKNTASWSTVYAHMWNATHTADAYPGPALPTFTFNGGTYYYAAIGSETTVIFGNNNDSRKTGDLTSANTHTRQYYEYSSSSWKDFTLSITYKDQGNVAFSGSQTSPPTTHTYGTATTLKIPTKTGYSFGGWFTASDCASGAVGDASSASLGATDYTADITLYAKWTAKTTTVTLNGNAPGGETVTGGGTTVTATYASALPSFSALTCTGGYALKGYYDATSDGNLIITSAGVFNANSGIWNRTDGSTLTLYAQWSLNRTLTYDANGGTGTMTDSNSPYANGATVTVKSNSFTRSGYTFTGWNTADNGSGASYAAGNTFSITANTTLYAQWSENMTTVTVNVSPTGTGTLTVAASAFTPGSTTTAGVTTSRTVVATAANDYTFDSWGVTGNATGTNSTNTYTLKGNGSAGTGTLTANFTLVPCSLMYGGSTPLNSPTSTVMSYDLEEQAYYIDVTTNSSPYYFRFLRDSKQWCGDWNTYPDVNEVTANGSKVACATETQVWYNKGSLKYIGESGTTIRIWFDYQNKQTWITADKDKQYVLRGANADDPSAAHGMPGWDATTSYFVGLASGNTGTVSCSLNAGEWYHLKVYDMYTKTWYGTSTSGATELIDGTLATMGSYDDFFFGATIADSYTFTLDKSSGMKIKVDYPVSYQVQLEVGTVKGNKQEPGIYLGSYDPANKIESGSYVPAGSHVIFVVASSLENAAKTGYTWCGFFDNAAGSTPTQYTNNEVTTYHINPIAADAHVYACFYENDYTVTVNAGTGGKVNSLSSTTITGHVATLANLPTATADPGYYFVNWTKTGTATLYSATSATAAQINGVTATNAVTVTANFEPKWSLAGSGAAFGNWATDANKFTTAYYQESTKWKGNKTITLAANTDYEIKMYDLQSTPHWYGTDHSSAAVHVYYANRGTAQSMSDTNESAKNLQIHSAAGGEYTFKWNVTDKSMQIVYPTSWYITTGQKTTGQDDNAGGSFTAVDNASNNVYGGKFVANNATVTFTATPNTGYNFVGWYSDASCETAYVNGTGGAAISGEGGVVLTLSSITADKTVYAKFEPKTYTVTLSQTGAASAGTANVTATYNAATPSIASLPTAANGYAFMGYYNATGGKGSQFVNASGTWATSVADTIADGKWVLDAGATLYAYFKKAEFTTLEHNATVAKGDVITLDVNPVLNVTPVDYTAICWTLHYSENDNEVPTSGDHYYSVASYTEGGSKPRQVRFTMTNLAVGSYYVKAVLKASASSSFDPCSTGTLLDTETGDFRIVGSSTVTINYQYYYTGDVIASSGSVEIEAESNADITAPEIIGYSFREWSLGVGVTKNSGELTDATINISSTYDGVVTAFYNKKQMIYFNNTLGWDDVYVYFYNTSNEYWANNYGTGANKKQYFNGKYPFGDGYYGHMTHIEGTDVWYFDYQAASIPTLTKVAFANKEQVYDKSPATNDEAYFHDASVVYRTDFDASHLSMFVPIDAVQHDYTANTGSKYYHGYWINYPENTGYKLMIFDRKGDGALFVKDQDFTHNANKRMPMSISLELEGGKTYGFKVYRNDVKWYGNGGTMTNGSSGDEGQTVWEFTTGTTNCGLTTTSSGIYTFTLSYGQDNYSNYNFLMGVRYPESVGDFRLQYKDNVNSTWKTSTVIPAVTESDTISYFVRKASTPYIRVQKCTAVDGSGNPTWTNQSSGANIISSLPSEITADGVYNFIFSKNNGALQLDTVASYTGNFYIRVGADGDLPWDNYRVSSQIMPFSEYSFNQTTNPYSHYFTKYYRTMNDNGTAADPSSINVTFVVANDYSTNISDTITTDDTGTSYVNASGILSGNNANIRFMYNYKTNVATRRYLDDAQGPRATDFLLLIPSDNTSIYDAETGGSGKTQVQLSDKGNWVYEANVWVVPGTEYQVKATFGRFGGSTITQYLKGAASGDHQYELLVGGEGSSRLQIRLLYDFKTNRIIAAYLPSGTIDENLEIDADIMFVREHQGNVTQITFGENKSISEIHNVYSVLRFNKSTINDYALSRYERDLFYISFPYNVLVSDIIGFGTYGTHWIIEYYDGADRAAKGFWKDSKSFWKFVTPAMASSYTLQAGTGYIVALDLDEMGYSSTIWDNTSTVELIFPGDISSISNQEVTYNMPIHQCNIGPRWEGASDRRIKDSHWNILGVPTYHNTTGSFANHTDEIGEKEQVWSADNAPKYLYTWNMTDNSLTVTDATGYNYKAMHAYVVQYYGDVTFHTSTNAVPAIVARRTYADAPSEVSFRMEIQQNDQMVDHTFVKLSNDETVSNEFVFGEDMSKEFNTNKANIYTMVTSILNDTATVTEVAGNILPMSDQTTVVPVGVTLTADGDYTFAIPDGTSGVGVTLVDTETGIRTSLSALSYTVNLTAGTHDGRFLLEIAPIQQTPTDIEEVTGDGLQVTGVRKVLIDQQMYIIRDGKMYDARGAMIK